jgi:hypothetical protein
MRRYAIVLFALVTLGACGGASKLSEAPRASSIQACFATRDAARGASAVVYATNGNYPKTFFAMTRGKVPALVANDDTTVTARTIEGKGWTLTMKGGGPSPPAFTCASAPRLAR